MTAKLTTTFSTGKSYHDRTDPQKNPRSRNLQTNTPKPKKKKTNDRILTKELQQGLPTRTQTKNSKFKRSTNENTSKDKTTKSQAPTSQRQKMKNKTNESKRQKDKSLNTRASQRKNRQAQHASKHAADP